ncbi:MAG: hypothetical protein JWR26_4350 [Pedosphaera sp.]|nr:hypothetical protein [Pedosphaera sp.]
MKMKNDKKEDQGFSPRGTGGGEVFGNRARAGAFGVKAGSWRNLCAAGDFTCCGQDARGPWGGRGLGEGRMAMPWVRSWRPVVAVCPEGAGRAGVGGEVFGHRAGAGEQALKTAGGTRLPVTWTLGGCQVARKGRWGGEKGSFKAPDQPLADACRRLPPVAAAYFPMCFFCGGFAGRPCLRKAGGLCPKG